MASKRDTSPETKVKDKLRRAIKRERESEGGKLRDNRLEMLVLIVNRNKVDYYVELLKTFEINMQLMMYGRGTANPSTLALLHLNDSDKAVLMGIIKAKKIKEAMETLTYKFETVRGGKGIGFTVPLTGVIGAYMYGFLSNDKMTIKDGE